MSAVLGSGTALSMSAVLGSGTALPMSAVLGSGMALAMIWSATAAGVVDWADSRGAGVQAAQDTTMVTDTAKVAELSRGRS